MTGPLQTVTRTARNRETAHHAYVNAILRARAAGHTLAAIGNAAGVTRNAVWAMIRNQERKPSP